MLSRGGGAVGVVDRKEAVQAGDKQASGEGTLDCLGGQALLAHNNGKGRGEWRNGGKGSEGGRWVERERGRERERDRERLVFVK